MRAIVAGNIRLYRGNRVLNHIISDRGRLLIGLFAFYLHASRRPEVPGSGLTAHRLKALCVECDICSPGRAGALLSLMRLFGHVRPATDPGDRRLKRLVPTELLIASVRERWQLIFSAIVPLLPEGATALAALDRDEFLMALTRIMAKHHRAGVRPMKLAPELSSFTDRNSGLKILFSLIMAGEPDDTVPPTRPVHIAVSELARRFSVSRVQVLRLFRDAAAAGLIERTESARGPAIRLLPPLSIFITRLLAAIFLFFAYCASAAMTELDAGRHGTADGG
jgi:DNA-binding MarR family transcriptional regulator